MWHTISMPSRNTLKEFQEKAYYHVYNRGVEKRNIFLDDQDYLIFLGLLKKYLAGESHNKKTNRHSFKTVGNKVKLLAYCLMPNHFHLLFYQIDEDGITLLMRRVMTGYVMYFNQKYQRVGSLFQGRYKASLINRDSYLDHISRYIHLNPKNFRAWPYSSYTYYVGNKKAKWLNTTFILDLFQGDKLVYQKFLEEYVDAKADLDLLKWELANGTEL